MTYEEAVSWSKYLKLRGTLHSGLQLEMNFAKALAFMASALGVKKKGGRDFTPSDFISHIETAPQELTIEDVLKGLGKQ